MNMPGSFECPCFDGVTFDHDYCKDIFNVQIKVIISIKLHHVLIWRLTMFVRVMDHFLMEMDSIVTFMIHA